MAIALFKSKQQSATVEVYSGRAADCVCSLPKLLGELVMRGLDPRIHPLREKVLTKIDGLPGQARQ